MRSPPSRPSAWQTRRIFVKHWPLCWFRATSRFALFEQAFDVFWRNPKLLEKMVAALLPRVYMAVRQIRFP